MYIIMDKYADHMTLCGAHCHHHHLLVLTSARGEGPKILINCGMLVITHTENNLPVFNNNAALVLH